MDRIANDIGMLEVQLRDIIDKATKNPGRFAGQGDSVLFYQGGELQATISVVLEKGALKFSGANDFASFKAELDPKITDLITKLEHETAHIAIRQPAPVPVSTFSMFAPGGRSKAPAVSEKPDPSPGKLTPPGK